MSAYPTRAFWLDWPFWLALSLGPVCWYVMVVLKVPLRDGPTPWRTLMWIAVIYPILEEFVFREGVQASLYRTSAMSRSVVGISLANVATSVLFAAVHLINQPPMWAALVFFPSLAFGWARDRYGNIHASVALHMIYNAGFIWFFQAG